MFSLAFTQMRPPSQADKSVHAKAEFMLEMTWPDGSLDDVDLWLLLPDGQKVGFNIELDRGGDDDHPHWAPKRMLPQDMSPKDPLPQEREPPRSRGLVVCRTGHDSPCASLRGAWLRFQ